MNPKNRDLPTHRMAWEKPYLEALIDQLTPSGEVLEVGFGLGYSSDQIQAFKPYHHVIIESNPEVAAEAKKWAKGKSSVTIIEDTWEHALPTLGVFDAIFFNDIHPEVEKTRNNTKMKTWIKKGADLVKNIKTQLPQITTIKYTDTDLDAFFSQVSGAKPSELAKFLQELKDNGQISKSQYENMLAKHNLEQTSFPLLKSVEKTSNPMLPFLKDCLKHHMHKGSRLSGFSLSPTSNFENPEFFEEIITNADYEYKEKTMPVEPPPACEYYPYKEALVMRIEKQT